MSATLDYTETLVVTSCYCGVPFAIPDNLYRWMQKSAKNSCHCPNGHVMHFSTDIEQKLREAKQREIATRDLLEAEQRSHNTTRGHLTRSKKKVARVENGVCPHCRRSFQNLARHMHSKHREEIE